MKHDEEEVIVLRIPLTQKTARALAKTMHNEKIQDLGLYVEKKMREKMNFYSKEKSANPGWMTNLLFYSFLWLLVMCTKYSHRRSRVFGYVEARISKKLYERYEFFRRSLLAPNIITQLQLGLILSEDE